MPFKTKAKPEMPQKIRRGRISALNCLLLLRELIEGSTIRG